MALVRPADPTTAHVVLLDAAGRTCGTAPKSTVHHHETPLHLAFSCYLVRRSDGAVLLTRRSFDKATWPGVWTNACCGHPQLGETWRSAIERRGAEELGVAVEDLEVLLDDFAYRAVMDDGTVEHERCPVFIGRIDGPLDPDPREVAEVEWTSWAALAGRTRTAPETLSPWSVAQLRRLAVGSRGPAPARGHAGMLDARIDLQQSW